ncbi:hypothetical protein GCM10008995_19660 [Halobellus salinus]|uniref:Uncharacterized protein n=1 Tax=Halobellus salinus TaxID=931585 RepID=A0A830EBT6_9EURY|nr:hypothetical protein GCM10008995_19660 [Halobellus salinus]SMP24866.1 hypothetical protein SAMN06265347_11072 [Halobellus salinus]
MRLRAPTTDTRHCENCGSHVTTERLEGTPVCTGCAVTERFALKPKYFYDENNLETFRGKYEQMLIQQKAMENRPLTGGGVLAVLLLVLGTLLASGIV